MKKGFTLAEVLITLAIIGVVASITLPALNANISVSKIGPALAKFANTWENGMRTYMIEDGRTEIDYNGIMDANLNKYIDWVKDERTYTISNLPSGTTIGEKRIIKDGTLLAFVSNKSGDWKAPSGIYNGYATIVFVDINGTKIPNEIGVDVFEFYVDKSGKIVAPGSLLFDQLNKDGSLAPSNAEKCSGLIQDNNWSAASVIGQCKTARTYP